jgi:hypothetical protein
MFRGCATRCFRAGGSPDRDARVSSRTLQGSSASSQDNSHGRLRIRRPHTLSHKGWGQLTLAQEGSLPGRPGRSARWDDTPSEESSSGRYFSESSIGHLTTPEPLFGSTLNASLPWSSSPIVAGRTVLTRPSRRSARHSTTLLGTECENDARGCTNSDARRARWR